jgi:deoxyribodipyrimidine photo-lyase
MPVHWHRRDLRVPDNRGLAAAAERGPVAPLFVFDDAVLAHAGPPRVRFMLDALAALREDYRDRGGDLLVARGDPREVVPEVAAEHDVGMVTWNRDYSGLAQRRDEAVKETLTDDGYTPQQFHDAIFHEPGSITTNKGDPYSVYTYFWKKWRDRDKPSPYPDPVDVADGDDAFAVAPGDGDPLPTIGELGFDRPEADVQAAGTDPARDRLESFCSGPITRYEDDRDYPTRNATSRLSTDLKWGTVGLREVYDATAAAKSAAETAGDDDAADSIEEFQAQLAWREFYTHVLYFNPSVVTDDYKSYENPIEWDDDEELLQAWRDGRTGYPIVDAGMRQLRAEAYMHNRVRMIVASFLTKDLLLDWRHGYAWFREKLADHDTANDNGGWQWAASTGTDAQPYFRIFNPMTQGERYDPDAEYIREYVPELADVPADQIHQWHELTPTQRRRTAPEYPAPIVDHSERREAALAMFERARGEADAES